MKFRCCLEVIVPRAAPGTCCYGVGVGMLLSAIFLVAGCSEASGDAEDGPEEAAEADAEQRDGVELVVLGDEAEAEHVVRIDLDGPGMRFDIEQFDVHAGSVVQLELVNSDAMVHNWLLVDGEPGVDELAVAEAVFDMQDPSGERFIPDDPRVLLASDVLQPGREQTITFEAPEQAGEYPYVCTIPGHARSMRGVMRVREPDAPLSDPVRATADDDAADADQMIERVGDEARVIRGHYPGVSPSAIGVGLPDGVHYVFDVQTAAVAYVWTGDFVDMSEERQARAARHGGAEPLGRRHHTHTFEQPLRLDDSQAVPEVRFQGYENRLGQLPELHYTINGHEVRLVVQGEIGEHGPVLEYTYAFDALPNEDVYWVMLAEPSIKLSSDAGTFADGVLHVPDDADASFTVKLAMGIPTRPSDDQLTAYQQAVLEDDPLVYWTFDRLDSEGRYRSLINDHPGNRLEPSSSLVPRGSTQTGDGASLGQAVRFNGRNDRLEADDVLDARDGIGLWAIELWVKPEAEGDQYLVQSGNNPGLVYGYTSSDAGSHVELYRSRGQRSGTDGPVLEQGQWHHLVVAFYGDDAGFGITNLHEFYVNGELAATVDDSSFSSPFASNADGFYVGSSESGDYFQGLIDELAIYDIGTRLGIEDPSDIDGEPDDLERRMREHVRSIVDHYTVVEDHNHTTGQ